MTWAELLSIIVRIKDQRISLDTLLITGGEPTLWPHLKECIALVRVNNIAKRIGILTNGIKRDAFDYEGADFVQITNYGAINRLDYIRLKKQMGKRLRITCNTHYDLPSESTNSPLPARCTCANYHFVRDTVYPCGRAARVDQNGLSVEDRFQEKFLAQNPYMQDLCKSCIANTKVKKKLGLTIELNVADSFFCKVINTNIKANWLRYLYNTIRPRLKTNEYAKMVNK